MTSVIQVLISWVNITKGARKFIFLSLPDWYILCNFEMVHLSCVLGNRYGLKCQSTLFKNTCFHSYMFPLRDPENIRWFYIVMLWVGIA
jgi:hypothetical protein